MSIVADGMYILKLKNLNKYLKHTDKEFGKIYLDYFEKTPELNVVIKEGFSFDSFKKLLPEIKNKENLDLTSGISIWIWNDNVVIKPYGLNYKINSKMIQPKYVKSFEYSNNCDKPSCIDGREWGRRKRFYNKTIDNIPRIEYKPFDFLSNSWFNNLCKLERVKNVMDKK